MHLSFFGEKHGKGQVDGLFGQIEGWIKKYLQKPGSRIATLDEMEQVLRDEATRATKLDAANPYIVLRWEPEMKPTSAWTLPTREFQISKTYCLHLRPGNPAIRIRNTSIVDHTFTDMVGQGSPPRTYPKVEQDAITDRGWRRGYFSNTRWDRKAPQRGETDAVLNRYEEHKRRNMKAPNLETEWEHTAKRRASRLLRRRAKWKLMKDAATSKDNPPEEPSDSSSSSSSSPSNSTEEG